MEAIIEYLLTVISIILFEHPILLCTALLVGSLSYISANRFLYKNAIDSQLVKQLEQVLSCYETYGCSDAPRFPHCIHQDKRAEILSRYENIPTHKLRYEAEANKNAAIAPGKHYSDFLISKLSKLIDQALSGCCTTLAISAVQKLLKLVDEELSGHRIEMVTSSHGMGSHCYIIFDREGLGDKGLIGERADDGISYPDLEDWGTKVLIIDPWAQSLGHGTGVYTVKSYPFAGYLSNLTQTYDNTVDHVIKREQENAASTYRQYRL